MNIKQEYGQTLKDLASTLLGVARESVALIKRSDQTQSLKWAQTQEWEIYLEFLKVMFNVVDRLSAFHVPLQVQPEFMNSLEDTVGEQLKTVLTPSMTSAEVDDMEILLSIGNTVAESRQLYEKFQFIISEDSKQKEAYFQLFGEQVAAKAGSSGNQNIIASAILCGQAVIPALQALFENTDASQETPSTQDPSAESSSTSSSPQSSNVQVIKLVSVMAKISGEEVETRWGVLPRFQKDLQKEEASQLAQHMNRVTRIVGERFAILSASADTQSTEPTGQA